MEKAFMKKIGMMSITFMLIIALFIGCSETISSGAGLEVYRFTITHPDPEASATGTFLKNWASAVMEASGGAIEIEIFHGGVLGGIRETINLVTNRVADMGQGGQSTMAGMFPITGVVALPMSGIKNAEHGNKVIWALYEMNQQLRDEYANFKVILLHTNCTAPISFSRRKVTSLNEMKGLNIRANPGPPTMFVEALNASPITITMAELFQAIDNNTVDGVIVDWHGLYSFKLHEAVRYVLDLPTYSNTFYFIMNKDSYNSLPDNLKAVIDEYSGWKAMEIASAIWDGYEVMCRDVISKNGRAEIITLSQEERAVFQAAADTVAEKWIAEMESLGLDGRTIYNQTVELVKKYAND